VLERGEIENRGAAVVGERLADRAFVFVELVSVRHAEPAQHAPAHSELDQIFVQDPEVAIGRPRRLRHSARRLAPGI
jgi:hypothetical protein